MSRATPEVVVFKSPEALYDAAADAFVREALAASRKKRFFTVALSGGSTPPHIHACLAADSRVDWTGVHVFWGDERHVPPDHDESNYGMARRTLLSKVRIPAANVHRICAEDADLDRAAAGYERTLREFFGLSPDEPPRFDLVLLGLGADGHTASLFPGSPILSSAPTDARRLVAVTHATAPPDRRVTLTPQSTTPPASCLLWPAGARPTR